VSYGVGPMTERAHYANAPITEALIDIKVTHAQDFSPDDLGMIKEAIGDRYPTQDPMYLHSGQISLQQPEDPMRVETTHQHGGFAFTSQNKQQIFQARVDGFTFSTLAPYDRWEPFRDEARSLWELYRSAAKVESITRAAVRYINRIDVPSAPPVQLEDYLRTYPEVSADMPSRALFANFFMQVQLWQDDLECLLIVNETLVPPPNDETTSIQLDLDLFRELVEPWAADEDAAAWDFLEQLHDRKNEVFEASITDATRRLIT
jgi:uncharacterized protein (TIGR04255 family)